MVLPPKRILILILSIALTMYTAFTIVQTTVIVSRPKGFTPWKTDAVEKVKTMHSMIEIAAKKRAEPKKHFVYIRVEKTGSTVMRAMFYTFAMKYELNMMRAGIEQDFMSTTEEKPGHYYNIGPYRTRLPDMAAEHAWFNEKFFDRNFPADTVYIGSVREPGKWFVSFVNFMNEFRKRSKTPQQVLADDQLYYLKSNYTAGRCTNMKRFNHNRQLQWFGFDVSKSDNVTAIESYIEFLSKKFDLILVSEYFDESLILLKRFMNWSFSDIFYQRYNFSLNNKTKLSTGEHNKLINIKHSYGDWLLHQHFNRTLWNKIRAERAFYTELTDFRRENSRVYNWCHKKPAFPGKRLVIKTRWEPEFTWTSGDCLRIAHQQDIKKHHYLDIPAIEDVIDNYSGIHN